MSWWYHHHHHHHQQQQQQQQNKIEPLFFSSQTCDTLSQVFLTEPKCHCLRFTEPQFWLLGRRNQCWRHNTAVRRKKSQVILRLQIQLVECWTCVQKVAGSNPDRWGHLHRKVKYTLSYCAWLRNWLILNFCNNRSRDIDTLKNYVQP